MEFEKRKYKRKEVKALFDAVNSVNESKTSDLRAQIEELKIQNAKLKALVFKYEEDETISHAVIKDAEKVAQKIKKEANDYLNLTMLNMKKLSKDWQEFFDFLKEKYPNYKIVTDQINTKKQIDEILSKNFDKNSANKINTILDKNKENNGQFNPRSIIDDYIAATSDSGFNLDEVLNPGDLKLEDLCKELGLIEPNE